MLQWREPEAVVARAEALTAAFLYERVIGDPAQLAARAYGDRLGQQLHGAVRGLLDWAHPLLGCAGPLPEGERWLLWPAGFPCPPVPSDVQLIPGARSCVAALTVVRGLQAGAIRPAERIAVKQHLA